MKVLRLLPLAFLADTRGFALLLGLVGPLLAVAGLARFLAAGLPGFLRLSRGASPPAANSRAGLPVT